MNFKDFENKKNEILSTDRSHLDDLGNQVVDMDQKIFELASLADEIGRVAWSGTYQKAARALSSECRQLAKEIAISTIASSNGAKGGAATSDAKKRASIANGKLGGRPKRKPKGE